MKVPPLWPVWSGCIEVLKESFREVLPGVHGSGRLKIPIITQIYTL